VRPDGAASESALLADVMTTQLGAAETTSWTALGWACVICIAISAVFAWRVDVNKFSLYMMYRNRLVRAYLGAINPGRSPHPFTGFDSNDDIALHRLAGPIDKQQRPYLIINAALNLVGGKELAWQTRKAGNFVFTPRFCGYEMPRTSVSAVATTADESAHGMFRQTHCMGVETTDADAAEKGVKLGMAMAVSGAAASPSMGYHSAPALTFLMTLFNVRLGRWCGNPSTKDGWKKASPPFGIRYLLKELLGQTDAQSEFLSRCMRRSKNIGLPERTWRDTVRTDTWCMARRQSSTPLAGLASCSSSALGASSHARFKPPRRRH
jgi:hypothetical protein